VTGLVGIISNDAARYSLFGSSAVRLRRPEGSHVEWLIGGDWCGARNQLVQQTLDGKYEWLWFMDDDHAFPPNLLERLLSHGDAIVYDDRIFAIDVVQPVCLERRWPFRPCQYAETTEDGKYAPIALKESPTEGLIELVAGGCAGMLIRRRVLETLEPPWFEYLDRSEDIAFCDRVKAAGFRLWCDLDAKLGHITTCTVWPATIDNDPENPEAGRHWETGFAVGGEFNLFTPIQEGDPS
jgi:hypothetical protein